MTNLASIGASFSLCLLLSPAIMGQMTRIDTRPIAAAYSRSLDSLVMVSAVPARLSLWNPATKTTTGSVNLPATPTALSLSPDGRSAAVGHDGRVTIVDLGALSIQRSFAVSCDVLSIVYGGNGWVYAFPRTDQWTKIRSVHIESGAEADGTYFPFYAGSVGKLMPGTSSIYIAQNGIGPDHIQKVDISNGPVTYLYDWQYHGTYSACGNLWMSPDGRRILTRCGSVFRSSPVKSEDMTYNGKLPMQLYLTGADFALSKDRILAVGTTQNYGDTNAGANKLYLMGYQNLNQVGTLEFPKFEVLGRMFPAYGRFVFANTEEDTWIAVVQADPSSGLLDDFAIVTGKLAGFVLHGATMSSGALAPDQTGVAVADLGNIPTLTSQENPAPTRLGELEVKFLGSDGVERWARILSINPFQIKFVAPSGMPSGPAQVFIDNFWSITRTTLDAVIQPVSPGIYTASGDGKGAPIGIARRVPASGAPVLSYLYKRDSSSSSIVPNPVVIPGQICTPSQDTVYLDLPVTGFRQAGNVTATLGGITVPVAISPDPAVDGQEKLVIGPLPTGSLRSGTFDLMLTADGIAANTTVIQLQYQ